MSDIPIPRETLSFLEVKRVGDADWVAHLEDFFGEAQPGDLLARIVLAASALAEGQPLHALQTIFVEPLTPAIPLSLRVARLGASDRLVSCEVGRAGAPLLCVAHAGFGVEADGLGYQEAKLPSGLPDPESLPTTLEYARREGWPEAYARGPLEFRRVGPLRAESGDGSAHVIWLRPRQQPPAAGALEAAVLAFASAFYPHWEFERRIGARFDHARFRLLRHALFVARPLRFDDWWLLRGQSQLAAGGRALARRELFTRDGRLIAAATLEAATHAQASPKMP